MEISFRHHRHRHHEEWSDRELQLMILAELEEIEEMISRLLPPTPTDAVSGTITFQGETMSDITLPAGTTTATATASFFDASGNGVAAQTPPVWSVSDPSVGVDTSADPSG